MLLSTQVKLGLGSALATLGALGIVLVPALGGSALPRPWSFLIGFLIGLITGLGGALALVGLIERRRAG